MFQQEKQPVTPTISHRTSLPAVGALSTLPMGPQERQEHSSQQGQFLFWLSSWLWQGFPVDMETPFGINSAHSTTNKKRFVPLSDHIHSELFFVPYTSPCICDNTRSVNFPYTDIYFLPATASDQWQQVSDKTDCISLNALFIPQLEHPRSLRDSAIGSCQGHSHKAQPKDFSQDREQKRSQPWEHGTARGLLAAQQRRAAQGCTSTLQITFIHR